MTPHNSAKIGDIAKTVLMPGDPLRAKVIAETFLESPVCFNTVRNMLGYTGTYMGKKVSVMGSGMGIPSIGIYSYELFEFYGVENIIRVGSAGGIGKDVKLMDVIIGMGACTDSNFAAQYKLPGTFAPIASYELLEKAVAASKANNASYKVGNLVSSDVFYGDYSGSGDDWRKMGVLAVEMEAAGLYMNAARLGKKALAIATVSDIIGSEEALSPEDRQNNFREMMKIALQVAVEME